MLTTRAHGFLDYSVGALIAFAPWLLGFAAGGPETWAMVAVGGLGMLYSLLTDYEMGLLRAIPMSMHLALDFCSGLFLAASPWLLGFADHVWAPHLALGLFEIGAAAFTSKLPSPQHARA